MPEPLEREGSSLDDLGTDAGVREDFEQERVRQTPVGHMDLRDAVFDGVDARPILDSLNFRIIPVVTPLAMDFHGQPYNINADLAACEIAMALHARKLVFISDAPGVLRDPKDESTLISEIRTSAVPGLIESGVLSGGMLPKIRSCVNAIENGVTQVHMADGRLPHSLLLEIFTNTGVGTQIIKG